MTEFDSQSQSLFNSKLKQDKKVFLKEHQLQKSASIRFDYS
mgnify:CR=1 FL=1